MYNMSDIIIKKGTRVREMFYNDFASLIERQMHEGDNCVYYLIPEYTSKNNKLDTGFDMQIDLDAFECNILRNMYFDGIALVLQHYDNAYYDTIFVVASDD